jgi:hypothetical protein
MPNAIRATSRPHAIAARSRGREPAVAPDRDRERVRELLDTGEFPRLAEVYRHQPDLEPPGDTFDLGLEWMFTGMQAVLDARRG